MARISGLQLEAKQRTPNLIRELLRKKWKKYRYGKVKNLLFRYNFDAPITESGDVTEKYEAIKKILGSVIENYEIYN